MSPTRKKSRAPKPTRLAEDVFVELVTPKGKVFSGRANAVEFSPANAVIQLEPGAVSYFASISAGELIVRIRSEFLFFALFRATASLQRGRLTVVAEIAEPLTASFRNCGNPMCDCLERAPSSPASASASNRRATARKPRRKRSDAVPLRSTTKSRERTA